MEFAAETRSICKSYGGRKVLQDLNIKIPAGSIYGLIGPNGAGKSTLMKILIGISRPQKGEAFLLGRSIKEKSGSIRSRVGYVPDVPVLYPSFTIAEMYNLGSRLYPGWDWARCRQLHKHYNLPEGQRIRNLSRGQAVQAALVLALSIRPQLILLDEPTAGLDPVMRRSFMQTIIDEVAERGTTIFYSTHNLNDLEQSADYIASLWQGELLFSSSLDELKASLSRIRVVFEEHVPQKIIASCPGIIDLQRNGRVQIVTVKGDIGGVFRQLQELKPLLIEQLDLSLEDIFLAVMKERGYSYENSNPAG